MNPTVQEYIDKQKEIAKNKELEKRAEFLESIGLFERIYSQNTKYTEEYPVRDTDENSENYGKYYKEEPLVLTDEEYEAVLSAYRLTNKKPVSEDSVALTLYYIAIFIYVIGGLLALFSFVAGVFSGIVSCVSVLISGTSFLGFSRIIYLLNDIKDK